MKLKNLVSSAALAAGAFASLGASADTITNSSGTFAFDGFDWNKAGVAWTQDLNLAGPGAVGSTFTEYFVGKSYEYGGSAGTYEYTVFATITEKVLSVSADFTTATFQVTGGSYTIYYDTSADASLTAGNGFTDGVAIISGTIGSDTGSTFTANSTFTAGQGDFVLKGTAVSLANINPALAATTAFSTLQFGTSQTVKIDATTVAPVIEGKQVGAPGQVIFQADANQSFTFAPVPEPSGLALVGAALAGLGFVARRRKQA